MAVSRVTVYLMELCLPIDLNILGNSTLIKIIWKESKINKCVVIFYKYNKKNFLSIKEIYFLYQNKYAVFHENNEGTKIKT